MKHDRNTCILRHVCGTCKHVDVSPVVLPCLGCGLDDCKWEFKGR